MSNDLWRTPKAIFNTLNKEFEFVADMAASDENWLVGNYFTEDDDSLNFKWLEHTRIGPFIGNAYVWCNCPYSNPMPWVKKAAEAQLDGLGVVMLLNNDMSVGWFAEALKTVSEIRCIVADPKEESPDKYHSGRLAFIDGDGKPCKGNNKPQFVLVFNPFKVGEHVTTYIKKSEIMGEL